ncbi:hypothetical protein TRVA0_018S00980 [Trichomonascus vanleenenianus]|uniref:DASH complex subunit ASK1 n=1 Tax=Trichomonascus vanleenenianus TaxID=2268995 RepID=UPI003ECB4D15
MGPTVSSQVLAEELERTEQSITLALQEIDRNFAKANKIVGESILPVLERYTQQSRNLWSGAAFWKQFLETAANVSLSGYEEDAHQYSEAGTTTVEESVLEEMVPIKTEEIKQEDADMTEDLSMPESVSTPKKETSSRPSSPTKIPRPIVTTPKLTPRKEPSMFLLDELNDEDADWAKDSLDLDMDSDSLLQEPKLSDFTTQIINRQAAATTPEKPKLSWNGNKTHSVLRHKVLDKNWRIQATPKAKAAKLIKIEDDVYASSPDIEPPKLRSHVFDSPADVSMSEANPLETPSKNRVPHTPKRMPQYDSDSDLDMLPDGMSPPVTIHFGKRESPGALIRTPAREAARTIVENILRDVGDDGEDDESSVNASITKTTQYKGMSFSDDDDDDDFSFGM